MSYDTAELSVQDGTPYFLYLFDDGTTQTRLTSEPDTVTASPEGSSHDYAASSISHGSLEATGNIRKSNADLTFALSDSNARQFLAPSQSLTTSVTIWRGHRGETDFKVFWKGRVVGAKSAGQNIVVTTENVFTSMRRLGCAARYQKLCRHCHYGPGCDLTRSDFEVAATASAISGLVVTVAAAALSADGEYRAGILNFGGVLGFITNHVGDQLTLFAPVAGLADAIGAGPVSIAIAPGCNLSSARCKTRFSNSDNFGGFIGFPNLNPFEVAIA